jgi:hypothetical protein
MLPATYRDLDCVVMNLPFSIVVLVFSRISAIQGRLSATPVAGMCCMAPACGGAVKRRTWISGTARGRRVTG